MKWRWGEGAVKGNTKVSELMLMAFTELRDPGRELVWGGWVWDQFGVLNQSEISVSFCPSRLGYLRAKTKSDSCKAPLCGLAQSRSLGNVSRDKMELRPTGSERWLTLIILFAHPHLLAPDLWHSDFWSFLSILFCLPHREPLELLPDQGGDCGEAWDALSGPG